MIEIRSLVKHHDGRPVADGLSLTVGQGETVAITGPSGCGKTTLLRMIAGLEAPDGGALFLAGRKLGAGDTAHERGIAFLFQSAALWPHMSVAGNIAFGIDDHPKAWRQARVREMLERVGLAGYADRSPANLSGGEARRVALARALAPQRPILLLDEPTANLNAALREQILDLIVDEQARHGTTVLLATHDPRDAARLSARCLTLANGCLLAGETS